MADERKADYYVEGGQEVVVDLFRPEDAVGATACFRTVYGEGYPIKTYLDPEQLAKANADKSVISSVARTAGGQVVGHNALFQSSPYPKIYESGAGVVLPAYRGGGLFERMIEHGIKVAAPLHGIEMVYGESVCNHPFSQKAVAALGYISMALEVDLMPASAYAKEGSAPGRVAGLLGMCHIAASPHAVYIPQAYAAELDYLYANTPDQRQKRPSQAPPPADSRSRLEARVFPFAQVARLTVHEAGEDLLQEARRAEKEAAGQGCRVFQIWLKLASPWVGASVDALRRDGWFFGGLLPRWFDEDGLLMQKMHQLPDWEHIVLVSDRAKELGAMARKDWERTQKG